MADLEGKVAIVTGSAQGIGATYAEALAANGARVMLADVLDGTETAARIAKSGQESAFVATDVTDQDSVSRLIAATMKKWGRIDILVNNAAIWASLKSAEFESIEPGEWDRVMSVNVKGSFLCAQAVVPIMRNQKYGRIVNIASGTVFKGTPGFLHYVTSKGAIVAFTRSLAREVAADGINVNTLAPGLVLSEKVVDNPELLESLSAPVMASRAIKRDQMPGDLIGPLLFLVSDDSAFMTGQATVVDGGSVMH